MPVFSSANLPVQTSEEDARLRDIALVVPVWSRLRALMSTTRAILSRRRRFAAFAPAANVGIASIDLSITTTAFYYGRNPPAEALSRYRQIVVEADGSPDLTVLRRYGSDVFAYVSVGEAEGWRDATRSLPSHLFPVSNSSWGSRIADLTNKEWISYLLNDRLPSLWASGYRGFFLDTLDSYRIAFRTRDERAEQQRALIQLMHEIHDRFPGTKLLINRGFELLPHVHHLLCGVVAESLFQSWNPEKNVYADSDPAGITWLLNELRQVTDRYGLPVTIIDYVDPSNHELVRKTSKRIEEFGYNAWIASPRLDTLYQKPSA